MADDRKGLLQLFEQFKSMGNLTTKLQWLQMFFFLVINAYLFFLGEM